MSVTFLKESENLFVVQIKGTFTFEDLKKIQDKARAEIEHSQRIKLLVLAEQFSGWGKEGDWGDLSFIEKIVVVTESKWKDEMLMFAGAGGRQASVEIFPEGKEEDARDWLQK